MRVCCISGQPKFKSIQLNDRNLALKCVRFDSANRGSGDIEISECQKANELCGTHEDERKVLFKTISLDGTKPNTNPKTKTKTNPNPNTNPNPKLTQILTLFSSFMLFSSTVPLSSV